MPDAASTEQVTRAYPDRVELADVPFVAQSSDTDCGPAALAMMLRWSGVEVEAAELEPLVYTPGREGTLQQDLIAAARRYGRMALPIRGHDALVDAMVAGYPVLVLQNLFISYWPQWHYAVTVGYDAREERIFLHSGERARIAVPFNDFDYTWGQAEEWALLVLSPEQPLPPSISEREALAAAAALEQAEQSAAAGAAYRSILRRWPDSADAMLGLANIAYSRNDAPGAIVQLEQALAIRPENGAAWNNLAHILAEQGELARARAAAAEALRLSGGNAEVFRATFRDIRLQELLRASSGG